MAGACCESEPRFDGLDPRYRRVLWLVIGLNAAMFVVEMAAGHLAGSVALQADALDFLGDTFTYGITLAVIGMPLATRAKAALFKGLSLTAMGLWVFGATAYSVLVLGVPRAELMGVVGFLALAANLASVLLLLRYRDGDANVRSVWLCSRNDAIGNVAVMFAAAGVWITATPWPDLVVAGVMAALFLTSSFRISRQAWSETTAVRAASRKAAAMPARSVPFTPGAGTRVTVDSTVTCPHCGHRQSETMPENACVILYDCKGCGASLRPLEEDCCVFCSYGSVPCPTASRTGMAASA